MHTLCLGIRGKMSITLSSLNGTIFCYAALSDGELSKCILRIEEETPRKTQEIKEARTQKDFSLKIFPVRKFQVTSVTLLIHHQYSNYL